MYNITILSYYANCSSYDNLFGAHFGENFADTIDECFYGNPIHFQYNPSGHYIGKAPMDKELDLNYLMGAIYAVYNCAKEPRRNSAMTKLLGYKYSDDFNGIRVRETFEHNVTPVVKLEDVDDNVGNAIIWAAYFFACIKASFHDEESEVRDYLRDLFLRQIKMDEYNYNLKHVGSLLYNLYFETTVKKIAEDLNEREEIPVKDEEWYWEEDYIKDCEEKDDKERETKTTNAEQKSAAPESETNINPEIERTLKTKDEAIANLTRQNEELKARLADLNEALNPTGILEGYESDVKSVFPRSFPLAGQTVGTLQRVRRAARQCIDPEEAKQVALFVEACRRADCAREFVIASPTKVVRSLIGLSVLGEDKGCKRYIEKVRRKLSSLNAEQTTDVDEKLLNNMIKRLKQD